jgi:capsular exopolysaccharide synthesis family protein
MVVSNVAPSSPPAEAYRGLRTAIQFSALDRSLRVLQVTSPTAGEGKTTTLVNLAVVLARGATSVCVVDCDLRRPRVHDFFGLKNNEGFTSVVRGELPLSAAVQTVPAENEIVVLAAGRPTLDPSELLASSRTKGVLGSLERQFDMVLVDSTPILPVTDAAVLSRHVEGVLIVVESGRTKKRALTRAVELLRQVDAPILGMVINRADQQSAYGSSYSSYTYSGPDVKPEARSDGRRDRNRPRQMAPHGTDQRAGVGRAGV